MPIYRIIGWEADFENFRTRKMKKLSWIPQKVSFDSDRIRALLRLGGAEAYGAFRVMCAVAAVCDPRGTLMTGMGTPHTSQTLEDKTGISAEVFERALHLCVNLKLVEIKCHVEDEGTAVPAGRCDEGTAVPTKYPPIEQKEQKERTTAQAGTTIPAEYPDKGTTIPSSGIAAAVVSEENVEEGPTLSKVVHELRGIGMDARVIPQLTASHPYPKILEAIEMVKARGNGVKNRAGLVRAALAGDWNTESATAGEDAYEEKRAAEHEAAARKRSDQRAEHAKMHAEHLEHMNTLAALPPDDFEALKDAAFAKMPAGLRKGIPEDSDPLEHGVWFSFMWTEHEKRHTSPQGDDLIPGGV